MKNVRFATCAAALVALSTAAHAATLVQPGYSEVTVGTVPDTTNYFGDMVFAADGVGFITGGFGSSIGDIYRLETDGSLNLLTTLSSTSLGVAERDGFVYAADETETIYKVNSTTGAKTTLATLSDTSAPNDVEIIDGIGGASFTIVVAQYSGAVTFLNGDTGAVQASFNVGTNLSSIDVAPDGTILGVDYSSRVVKFDDAGLISTTTVGAAYDGIAVRQDTGTVFGYGPGTVGIDIVDLIGPGTQDFANGTIGDGGYYPGVFAFSHDGTRLYFGERADVGGLGIRYIDGFAAYDIDAPAPVPLPAGLPVLMAGVGLLGLLRRKSA